MKILLRVLTVVLGVLFSLNLNAADLPCDCPKLACDPCSRETGVKFYSEKCGPNSSKMRSCGRPNCVPLTETTETCPVLPQVSGGLTEPVVVKPKVTEANVEDDRARVGHVKVIKGEVQIKSDGGKLTTVSHDTELRERETLIASADSAALIDLEGGNKIHVHPATEVEVKEHKDPKVENSRRTLINLIKGKIRNQVEQKYNGKTSTYRVLSKGAVAGVRGTDFVISQTQDSKFETRIETLSGRVRLSDLDDKQAVNLKAGEGVVFVSEVPTDTSLEEFAVKGKFSPVFKITAERLAELDKESRVDVAKAKIRPAAEQVHICRAPKAYFNQCAWGCVGNAEGQKNCRTDKVGVSCVRRRCNANGDWAEETTLPQTQGALACPGQGFTVKACDY
jgi:hypothetical protein